MAKEIKLGKRAKITQAQQYMALAVFGAAIFLGAAIAVVLNSINKISFSASIIAAQDQSIVSFSDTIKNIGICPKPRGQVYSDDELKKCAPNSVTASDVPNTLRSNILENMASNSALASVPNRNNPDCINQKTNKNYTYKELEDNYAAAGESGNEEQLIAASNLIKSCSSLRVIPDALPAFRNEEALLASIDKIFRDSGTEPESLTPTGETDWALFGNNLYNIPVRLSIEASTGTIHTFLSNVERSIRNFNIERATIEWNTDSTINFQARGTAYYVQPSVLTTTDKAIKPGGK
ncbi:hypothetical protein J6S55_00905 [Candidatus Saccharibacteria bacterium]|nr:hypothetical protein [Candidatus Saccharibacteria bacterium]